MNARIDELTKRIKEIQAKLDAIIPKIAKMRKIASKPTATEEVRKNLTELEDQGRKLLKDHDRFVDEFQSLPGIPEEFFKTIEKEEARGDSEVRLMRDTLSDEKVKATGIIEEQLPETLEKIKGILDYNWLKKEREKQFRLDLKFLNKPLSIVRGLRLESEEMSVHRFAQGILVAEDYLASNPEYDFFAGALLIPQLISLASKLPALSDVTGEVNDRVRALWKHNSNFADSTIYELLVAGSGAILGRKMEFLSTTHEKTPDLRVHDNPFPLVIECKRRQAITDYEKAEEGSMRNLFTAMLDACRRKGLSGIFEINLKIEANKMVVHEISECAILQRLSAYPEKSLEYKWGTISFRELPNKIDMPTTKLYSPQFLNSLFDWNSDMPKHDGIICAVKPPDNIFIDSVRFPLALLWTCSSPSAILRRTRTISSLFGKATKQVPSGEGGIIYVCYQEGTRPEIADNRLHFLEKELKDWKHEPSIRIPISFITRLFPRPLGEGYPDLIENCINIHSKTYGNPILFKKFPATVFT